MVVNPEKTRFGRKTVTPQEKTGLVRGVFDSVADQYDLMNDVMSAGLHRLWKDRFVRMIRPRAGLRYLDVAGGTGDIAFRIKKKISPSPLSSPLRDRVIRGKADDRVRDITICDLTPAMLEEGRNRALDQGWLNEFQWITGNAEALPFEDKSFDVYTIAFGLRNVTHIDTALAEAWRVLKPGGRFFCLEFSRIDHPVLSKIYDAYSFHMIPALGAAIAQDRQSYQYLVESIRTFPSPNALQTRMITSGFTKVSYVKMTAGVVAIHTGFKK